ncbi:MAG: hypothetical protein AAAFM81_14025 [Pseudomonadota bacterium]
MSLLEMLLWIKIVGTLVAVAGPLLLLPKSLIDRIGGFSASDVALYRLYGMALLVGYGSGIVDVRAAVFPTGVIIMGLVSNGGATLIMLSSGYARKRPLAPVFFGAIAIGLGLAMLMPEAAMR